MWIFRCCQTACLNKCIVALWWCDHHIIWPMLNNHQKPSNMKEYPKTISKPSNTMATPNHSIQRWLLRWVPSKEMSIWQHLPCPIFKILQRRFKKLAIIQKQALLCLIFKTWLSRFRKMFIRQNQTWPYIISKIWWSTFIEIPDKIRPGPFLFPKFDWVDFKRC